MKNKNVLKIISALSILVVLLLISVVIEKLGNQRNNSTKIEENISTKNNICEDPETQSDMNVCSNEEAQDTYILLVSAIEKTKMEHSTNDNLQAILESLKEQYKKDAIKTCEIENKDTEGGSVYPMMISLCVNDYYKEDLEKFLQKYPINNFDVSFPIFPNYNKTTMYSFKNGTDEHVLTIKRISKGGIEFTDETKHFNKVIDSFGSYARLNDYFWVANGTIDTNDDVSVLANEFNFDLESGCAGSVSIDIDGNFASLVTKGCNDNAYRDFNGLYSLIK